MSDTGAGKPRDKRIGYLIWGFVVVSVASTILWRCLADDTAPGAGLTYKCLPEPPRGIVCSFENDSATLGFCFDLVLDCQGTEHRAEVCVGPMPAGTRADVRPPEMTPPLPSKPVCTPPRYQNPRTP